MFTSTHKHAYDFFRNQGFESLRRSLKHLALMDVIINKNAFCDNERCILAKQLRCYVESFEHY